MESFLKWAGGKRWLISKADRLLPDLNKVNRYFEPFLGGGSMFFHLQPQTAYLSDVNADLINSYLVIRDNCYELYKILRKYHKLHSEDFYYQIRSSNPRTPLQRAARFIYLNRTCWNGLYRVNKKGKFNVPIGSKKNVILDDDKFEQLSAILKSAHLEACDFEVTIDKAAKDDFVFIDPPYTVKHNLNGFIKYNENIFSWQDQVRLKNSISRAVNRGAYVLVMNANHKSIEELYHGTGKMFLLNRASVIAGNSEARGIYSELAIKSW
ncbi:MAG TPA: Dam family site-specific DNA-(adenine-N6)-methyltransferase [Chitinophagaceae bacterium]|jgi:DNA adenine methylase|nr:Dam family site-specific DNA-(adenine-N6)-methyltransferase [Chitinophagaceae bacterium]